MDCASGNPSESLKGKTLANVKCAKFGGTYYGVVPVGEVMYMLHARFVDKRKEQQRYLHASHKPVNFTAAQDKILLSSDGACHNLFVITDDATVSVLNHIFSKEYVAFAIGGQHSISPKLAGRDGINLFQIDESLRCHRATFVIDGNHEGVVELRPKCKGRGEFDGQSTLHYSIA